MSLINDVLRNLEANRPDDLAGHNLQREIRSLPAAPPPRHGRRQILLGLLLLAVAGGAWYGHDRLDAWLLPEPPAPLPAAVAPPVPAAPVAVHAPPPAPPPENVLIAQQLLAAPPVAVPAAVPVAAAPPLQAPAAPAAPPLATAPPAALPVAPAQPKTEATPAVAPAAVKIEKSPVLATPHDRAEADWRRAEAALAGGRGEEGREALRSALRHDPGHVQVRQALLRNLLDGRRIDEAVVVLQDGLELQPAQAGWAMSLARLQLELGDPAAADRTLARTQGFAENSADYAGFQGHLKTRLGAHRQAAAHYQRATRLVPGDGRWWLGLGLALESDGRSAESREALRRALATGTLAGELAAVAEQHLR
ncbi:MAG TPA: tetratricopeptide repeat protein [Azonexus sp.]